MYDSGIIFHSDRKYDSIVKYNTTSVGAYGTTTTLVTGIVGTPSFLVGFMDSSGSMSKANGIGSGFSYLSGGNLYYYSAGAGTCYWRVYGD